MDNACIDIACIDMLQMNVLPRSSSASFMNTPERRRPMSPALNSTPFASPGGYTKWLLLSSCSTSLKDAPPGTRVGSAASACVAEGGLSPSASLSTKETGSDGPAAAIVLRKPQRTNVSRYNKVKEEQSFIVLEVKSP